MPRGKISSQTLVSLPNVGEDGDNNAGTKQGPAKFTLIMPDSESGELQEAVVDRLPEFPIAKTEPPSMNIKFTLLLVTLFVVVNAGLVAILDNDKTDNTAAIVPLPKSENAIVRLPAAKPYVKTNDAQPLSVATPVETPAAVQSARQATPAQVVPVQEAPVQDSAAQEKPVLDTPEEDKPALDNGKSLPVASTPQKSTAEKPLPVQPEAAGQNDARPANGADLLSIINRQ